MVVWPRRQLRRSALAEWRRALPRWLEGVAAGLKESASPRPPSEIRCRRRRSPGAWKSRARRKRGQRTGRGARHVVPQKGISGSSGMKKTVMPGIGATPELSPGSQQEHPTPSPSAPPSPPPPLFFASLLLPHPPSVFILPPSSPFPSYHPPVFISFRLPPPLYLKFLFLPTSRAGSIPSLLLSSLRHLSSISLCSFIPNLFLIFALLLSVLSFYYYPFIKVKYCCPFFVAWSFFGIINSHFSVLSLLHLTFSCLV